MPAPALAPPATTEPETIFGLVQRGRIDPSPWVEMTFYQADPILGADDAPLLNTVGLPMYRARAQSTVLRTAHPPKLAELEGRVCAYVRAGKGSDDAEATVAYEELEACRAAGTLYGISVLGYTVGGNYIPWS